MSEMPEGFVYFFAETAGFLVQQHHKLRDAGGNITAGHCRLIILAFQKNDVFCSFRFQLYRTFMTPQIA
ncbi:hypothetical protein KFE80_06140 [bacterium SCSIO 12696]|nr:hypothetical protein KFE80_06140 [bacterium SCSIO 12696]